MQNASSENAGVNFTNASSNVFQSENFAGTRIDRKADSPQKSFVLKVPPL